MTAKLATISDQSKKILKEYDLCNYCLGRLYAKKLGITSYSQFGQKTQKIPSRKNVKCYICKNIFESLPFYLDKMLDATSDYEFRTFVVGTILKPSVLDRDDHIRSQFKLRGIDSIKTSITRHLAKQFAIKTKRKHNQMNPDLTITVDFKTESCKVQSRPLFVSARYIKQIRGIPQKQKHCENCLGKGCLCCNNHGMTEFNSVEGIICKYLFESFAASQVRITWIGGEDSNSLVLGSGRPFFAKIMTPKKRTSKIPKQIKLDKLIIKSLKQVTKIPSDPIHFVSKAKILVTTEKPLQPQDLSKLEHIQKKIVVYDDDKKTEKSIYDLKYKQESENSFYLYLKLDGGIPIKRFVSGENVFPNISDLLSNKSKCEVFDFDDVTILN